MGRILISCLFRNFCPPCTCRWMVENSEYLPEATSFLCDVCLRALHYDAHGRPVSEFQAFAYVDRSKLCWVFSWLVIAHSPPRPDCPFHQSISAPPRHPPLCTFFLHCISLLPLSCLPIVFNSVSFFCIHVFHSNVKFMYIHLILNAYVHVLF